MAADIKTELYIPDVWYDFFARFLPGAVFIGALRILVLGDTSYPDIASLVVLGIAGYISALVSQPVASALVRVIEANVGWPPDSGHRTGKNEQEFDRILFVRKVQYQFGESSRQSLVLGKMHAETTCFVQLAILTIALVAILVLSGKYAWSSFIVPVVVVAVLMFNACIVANSRVNRASQLMEAKRKKAQM